MPSKGKISAAERRRQDYLRRKGLRVASVYEVRLEKARRKELRRVLDMAKDYSDPIAIVPLIQGQIDETDYLGKWWNGLVVDAGLPIAKATARDLRAAKASEEEDLWLASLRRFAANRAGQEISVVTGTWKNSLVSLLRAILEEEIGSGIEKVTDELYRRYLTTLEKWQCRRIAQTECLIGTAQAAADAASTLSIQFTKQWCISGLGNTRASHELMDGVIVDQDEPFSLPGGTMMYPHDTSMNADAGEIINCACSCIRRPYSASEIASESNEELTEKEKRIRELMQEMDSSYPDDLKRAKAENYMAIEKKMKIRKGAAMTIDEADKQSTNPLFFQEKQYQTNCATCANAFVLREQGFDVVAKGNISGSGSLNDIISKTDLAQLWKTADGKKVQSTHVRKWMADNNVGSYMTPESYKRFYEEVCREPGTYITTLRWRVGWNHATIIKRLEDGRLVRIEPQVYYESKGSLRSMEELCGKLETYSVNLKNCGVFRVDDKLFSPKFCGLFDVK